MAVTLNIPESDFLLNAVILGLRLAQEFRAVYLMLRPGQGLQIVLESRSHPVDGKQLLPCLPQNLGSF